MATCCLQTHGCLTEGLSADRSGSFSGLAGEVAAESRGKEFLIWVIDINMIGNALGHVAVFISIINNM